MPNESDILSIIANIMQVLNFVENATQTSNDKLMKALQYQNQKYLEIIITKLERMEIMYNLEKADEIYRTRLKQDPQFANKMIAHWKDKMPEEFARYMYEDEYGCHIVDEDMYDKAISYLKWADEEGQGAKWEIETLVKLADIDFDESKFTKLDFAYVANMLYSDYCHIFTDSDYYIKMAEAYLTDEDYPGHACERAYKNALKRIKYFEK